MKKGFTLVEILAVIALLSIIIVLAVPSITKLREDSLETEANNQKNQIESIGVLYSYDMKYHNCYIKLQTLIDAGYLKTNEANDIINPKTKESLKNDVVVITSSSNNKNSGSLIKFNELNSESIECN